MQPKALTDLKGLASRFRWTETDDMQLLWAEFSPDDARNPFADHEKPTPPFSRKERSKS